MFKIPVQAALTIRKNVGSGQVSVTIDREKGWDIDFAFPKFIPFSKTDVSLDFRRLLGRT